MKCKVCGSEMPEGTTICSVCGTPMEEPETMQNTEEAAPAAENIQPEHVCPVCGKPLLEGSKFCYFCGADLTAVNKAETKPAQPVCPVCGNPVLDGATFCSVCGAKLDGSAPARASVKTTAPKQTNTAAPARSVSFKLTKTAKTAIAAVLALVLLVAGFKVLYKPTADLNKYVTVEFSGADGYGKATQYFDTQKLYKDFSKKTDFDYKALVEFINEWDDYGYDFKDYIGSLSATELNDLKKGKDREALFKMYLALMQQYGIFPEVEPVDEDIQANRLSNGNKVRLTWDEEDYTKKWVQSCSDIFGIKIKYSDKEYTVKDLDKVSVKDIFADITVEFSGISPDGRAEVVNNSKADEIRNLNFELDKDSDLKNGDTVTVTIYGDESEISAKLAGAKGYVPEAFTKEYTVEGLDHYIASIDELSDADKQKIAAQTEDQLTSITASWVDGAWIDSMSYMGSYLLTPKEGSGNRLIYVYTVYAKYDADGITGELTYYYPMEYNNIVMKADGTSGLNVMDYEPSDNSFTKTFESENDSIRLRYYGYESVTDLEKNIVQPFVNTCTVTKDF